jgi:hypothetical protein
MKISLFVLVISERMLGEYESGLSLYDERRDLIGYLHIDKET